MKYVHNAVDELLAAATFHCEREHLEDVPTLLTNAANWFRDDDEKYMAELFNHLAATYQPPTGEPS